jgi:hypothetical protein
MIKYVQNLEYSFFGDTISFIELKARLHSDEDIAIVLIAEV